MGAMTVSGAASSETSSLARLIVPPGTILDAWALAVGLLAPLRGFMDETQARSVLERMRLPGGEVFTLPILLPIPRDAPVRAGDRVALASEPEGIPVALVEIEERFTLPREHLTSRVLSTSREDHPGRPLLARLGETFAAGAVRWIAPLPPHPLALTPARAKALFAALGWRRVAAFQTRNVPHRAHEWVHAVLLGLADGLLIHPVVGPKKRGDFQDDLIVRANQALLDAYYPADRARVAPLPYAMRYAGPREAVHHAILRRNLGCTHFAVGRDHAGAPGFYAPEAAIDLATSLPDLGIEIVPVRGDHFWCATCGTVTSERACRHPASSRLKFSGTLLRKLILEGRAPPPEAMRPEVAAAILACAEPFVAGGA